MKKYSVKLKITLWYTVFMTFLVLLCLSLLFTISNSRVLSSTENRLKNTVLKSFREVGISQAVPRFSDDFITLGIGEGIYLSAYDEQGNFLYGSLPSFYDGTDYLIPDELQQEYDFFTQWYIYDSFMKLDTNVSLWIRGITSPTAAERMMVSLIRISLILFPFFLALASFGGYLIIRSTLAPLDKVTATAAAISKENDLSRRISLDKGTDEVHLLAHTFDHMIERLSSSFEREKQFTSDVSHELRTPVTVILSQCEYALSEHATSKDQKEALTSIQHQAKRISRLISQLLLLARADSGRLVCQKEHIHLSQLAEAVCEEQKEAALKKRIQLHSRIQPNLYLYCDETMMMRMFINLLNNAITYGKEGGNILLTLSRKQNVLEGSVQDDGIGISPKHLPHIWERFYQADDSRTQYNKEEQGSGLGLPMVKWIVEAHDGKIEAKSIPKKGTVFSFTFPLK